MAGWTSSDAWVLASLPGPGRDAGVALWRVLFRGDHLNRAVLTEDEFRVGVGRLIAAGLAGADVAADRYWLTDAGVALIRRLFPDPDGEFDWFERLPPALAALGEPSPDVLSLPPGHFDRAARRYTKEFWAIYRRLDAE